MKLVKLLEDILLGIGFAFAVVCAAVGLVALFRAVAQLIFGG